MTYTEANERLRRRTSLRLPGRYTTLVRLDDGGIAVHLVATNVVTFRPCGRVILNSGGWRTVTTKERISRYSGMYVRQRDGDWTVHTGTHIYSFTDGMVLKDEEMIR